MKEYVQLLHIMQLLHASYVQLLHNLIPPPPSFFSLLWGLQKP